VHKRVLDASASYGVEEAHTCIFLLCLLDILGWRTRHEWRRRGFDARRWGGGGAECRRRRRRSVVVGLLLLSGIFSTELRLLLSGCEWPEATSRRWNGRRETGTIDGAWRRNGMWLLGKCRCILLLISSAEKLLL